MSLFSVLSSLVKSFDGVGTVTYPICNEMLGHQMCIDKIQFVNHCYFKNVYYE